MLHKYNYPKNINLIFNALANIDSQIARDFNEISLLQSGRLLPHRYSNKLIEIASKQLCYNLQKFLPKYGIIINNEIIVENTFSNKYILINIFDGFENLLRSIPYFTVNISLVTISNLEELEIDEIIAATVYNPILNLFYWSEAGGASQEKLYKLKTSLVGKKPEDTETPYSINFNCPSLELCFLANGKIDFLNISFNHLNDIIAAKFIAENAGANIKVDLENKTIAATN